MTSRDFIKEFNEISVSNICKEIGIAPQNIYSGRAKSDDIVLVGYMIRYKMENLLIKYKYSPYTKVYDRRKMEVLDD